MGAVVTGLDFTLPDDEVRVWRASLDQPADAVRHLEGRLSLDELERADRFRFDTDRRRFVVGRGILRSVLGGYLDMPPEELRFRYGEFGKPALDEPGPSFNVSHAGPMALFAFASALEIGVDIELSTAGQEGERIAKHFFSPAEVRHLRSLPGRHRPAAFLACWTRKEAFIKARGDGLSLPLDAFDVGFGPGQPCRLLRTAWSLDEPGEWHLVDLSDPSGGYVAALAARDRSFRVVSRSLDPVHLRRKSPILEEMT